MLYQALHTQTITLLTRLGKKTVEAYHENSSEASSSGHRRIVQFIHINIGLDTILFCSDLMFLGGAKLWLWRVSLSAVFFSQLITLVFSFLTTQ